MWSGVDASTRHEFGFRHEGLYLYNSQGLQVGNNFAGQLSFNFLNIMCGVSCKQSVAKPIHEQRVDNAEATGCCPLATYVGCVTTPAPVE